MPSCLLLESIIKIWSTKGGCHHEDPVIIFPLTSSRIDSLRASQYLVDLILLSAYIPKNLKGNKIVCGYES
jgi:hypothetical protein